MATSPAGISDIYPIFLMGICIAHPSRLNPKSASEMNLKLYFVLKFRSPNHGTLLDPNRVVVAGGHSAS